MPSLSRRLKLSKALERKDPSGACLDPAAEYIEGGQIRIGILDAPCHALDPIDSGGRSRISMRRRFGISLRRSLVRPVSLAKPASDGAPCICLLR